MGKNRPNRDHDSAEEPSAKSHKGQKIKKSLAKASKARDKAAAILKIEAKSVKNKERRKDLVRRQKVESHKLKKLQKLKEKKVRLEHGEAV